MGGGAQRETSRARIRNTRQMVEVDLSAEKTCELGKEEPGVLRRAKGRIFPGEEARSAKALRQE